MTEVRMGSFCKHSWGGVNTGSISITTREVVLETELSQYTQNSLQISWQCLKKNAFKMGGKMGR